MRGQSVTHVVVDELNLPKRLTVLSFKAYKTETGGRIFAAQVLGNADEVRKTWSSPNIQLGDFVILTADGRPLFMSELDFGDKYERVTDK